MLPLSFTEALHCADLVASSPSQSLPRPPRPPRRKLLQKPHASRPHITQDSDRLLRHGISRVNRGPNWAIRRLGDVPHHVERAALYAVVSALPAIIVSGSASPLSYLTLPCEYTLANLAAPYLAAQRHQPRRWRPGRSCRHAAPHRLRARPRSPPACHPDWRGARRGFAPV